MKCFGIYSSAGANFSDGFHYAIATGEPFKDDTIYLVQKQDGKFSQPFGSGDFQSECQFQHPVTPLIFHQYEDGFEVEKYSDTPLWVNWETGRFILNPFTWMGSSEPESATQLRDWLESYCNINLSLANVINYWLMGTISKRRQWILNLKANEHLKWVGNQEDVLGQLLDLIAPETASLKIAPKVPIYSWIVRNNGVFERQPVEE